MKKIILIPAFILGATVYAQKGSWYLGGNAGFGTNSTTYTNESVLSRKSKTWALSPEIGTFLTNRIQLGLEIGAKGTNFRSTNYHLATLSTVESLQKDLMFGGAVYSRYLFGDKPFKPFLGIRAAYYTGQTRSYASSEDNFFTSGYTNQFSIGLTAGFSYYVTPKLGIFGSVSLLEYMHNRNSATSQGPTTYSAFSFSPNTILNSFKIGIYYTICQGKSKE